MGQAKRRKGALKEQLLLHADWWTFAPTDWEGILVRQLLDLPAFVIPRMDEKDLAAMKMAPNQCHANVRWYERNDPTGQSRAISGWWVRQCDFVLHSVLTNGTDYFCITPGEPGEREIVFIPDPDIVWAESGGNCAALRNGQEIGVGVRRFPALTIAMQEMVRYRLCIGMDPDQAQYFSDEELDALTRQHLTADERKLFLEG